MKLRITILIPVFLMSLASFAGSVPDKLFAFALVNSAIDTSELRQHGIEVNTKAGKVWTLRFPARTLPLLTSIKGIDYVQVSNNLNALRVQNDKAIAASKIDKLHAGEAPSAPMGLSGKGVVIGIVDIGFQFNHPTFYNANGTQYRVKRYWNQNSTNGTPPSGFTYGKECTTESEILAQYELDGTHGTHVAGIAGGSGFGTPGNIAKGVAPDADLVFVSIKYSNDTLGGSALGDYIVANPTIIDAYNYIFQYAQSVGKPCVINLSWGMHTGPHDGTSIFDFACEQLVGPGKIIVGALGNNGATAMHISHTFNNDTFSTFMVENGRKATESVYADFWGSYNTSFNLKVSIMDSLSNIVAATPFVSSATDEETVFVLYDGSDSFKVKFWAENSFITNNKPNILVMTENSNAGRYYLVLSATGSGTLHGWNSGAVYKWTDGTFRDKIGTQNKENSFKKGDTKYTLGENGGTGGLVISVGAYAARNIFQNFKGDTINDSWYVAEGDLAPFSSRGPRVDGVSKPDITAPGFLVMSALHKDQIPGWMWDRVLYKSTVLGDTNYYGVLSGTSMAAPHVTGFVALLLEYQKIINPDAPVFSPAEIRDIITVTANKDWWVEQKGTSDWGPGKLDAYGAVSYTFQHFASLSVPYSKVKVWPNPVKDKCRISLPIDADNGVFEIYDVAGRLLAGYSLVAQSGVFTLDFSTLAPGLYQVRLYTNTENYYFKIQKEN